MIKVSRCPVCGKWAEVEIDKKTGREYVRCDDKPGLKIFIDEAPKEEVQP